MPRVSDRAKILYLVILMLFIIGVFLAWLDHVGIIDIARLTGAANRADLVSVMDAKDDEPSLVAREEFEQQKLKLQERIEDLDRREARIVEAEKSIESEREKIFEMKKGIDFERKKFEGEKNRYKGYAKNVKVLANKIENIPPKQAVKILEKWEDVLVIDVFRQMDANAEEAGKQSITAYLMSLMPQNKSSRIMYLMTQM
jgi:flagellar protein FlbB